MIKSANLKIGHATDPEFHTGCTVFLCPDQTVGGVDVRGMAPGSRETELLNPIKSVPFINAIVLTGGSAFGLATADGVMQYLAENDIGHFTPIRRIPIVPAAVVFDLFLGEGKRTPNAQMGYQAAVNATLDGDIAQGCVGAGAGVTVGKWAGFKNMMKGGFGVASLTLEEGVEMFAAAVVNAVGDVVQEDGSVLAGAWDQEGWLVNRNPLRRYPAAFPTSLTNTTLVLVATTAQLNKVETNRLAQRAHDGLAIAIRPVHTMHDGDTVFALSTGGIQGVHFDVLGNAAVAVVAEAIRSAVRHAHTTAGVHGLAGTHP